MASNLHDELCARGLGFSLQAGESFHLAAQHFAIEDREGHLVVRDLGSPPHSKTFFHAITDGLGESVRLFVVRQDDREYFCVASPAGLQVKDGSTTIPIDPFAGVFNIGIGGGDKGLDSVIVNN